MPIEAHQCVTASTILRSISGDGKDAGHFNLYDAGTTISMRFSLSIECNVDNVHASFTSKHGSNYNNTHGNWLTTTGRIDENLPHLQALAACLAERRRRYKGTFYFREEVLDVCGGGAPMG